MATLVTLTAGHAGHLWISWFDTGTNKISVVRTNAAVTRFGRVRKGVVKFTVKKGTAKGKHTVIATKTGYASATFTVKVT
jgi:hypothetical protein